jgi:hypothetical protein
MFVLRLVRSFQSGERARLSQRILNELATTKLCLLDPEKRNAYATDAVVPIDVFIVFKLVLQ